MKIEIKNAPSQEVDWSSVNHLVRIDRLKTSDIDRIVLITEGNPSRPDCFCGVDILNGHYSSGWMKMFFQPFNGEITLKND